ncbi:unnamed protein product [Miscanthus lutarioriparius]|uniref:Nascent polypeptide-associated complex subunit beta n=1 Tax=Miscanthus lutarioriparius TaxID=422564 RepID=A0A811MZ33_9POAL|nr:unnamed protein product [Miscanthus lutarioriparius]
MAELRAREGRGRGGRRGRARMNVEKLKKMAGAVRTGGKGSMRRKKKAVHKTTTTDDKRLQSTLKRIGVNTIPGIEEVNIFKDDVVIQFVNPKVQASIGANTWVVSGTPQTKKLQDLLPSIINQLGPDNLDNLRRLAEQFQKHALVLLVQRLVPAQVLLRTMMTTFLSLSLERHLRRPWKRKRSHHNFATGLLL